jgi:hypothetical protein
MLKSSATILLEALLPCEDLGSGVLVVGCGVSADVLSSVTVVVDESVIVVSTVVVSSDATYRLDTAHWT